MLGYKDICVRVCVCVCVCVCVYVYVVVLFKLIKPTQVQVNNARRNAIGAQIVDSDV